MKSLFSLPWFSHGAFSGIDAAFHKGEEASLRLEGSFMSQLVLQLLDQQRADELYNAGLYDFYAFCQQRLHRSHAQILQDLWVLFMLKEKREGFFVEFGACDGVTLSNTLLLENGYGWTGILAEPNPHWSVGLKSNGRCRISKKCIAAESGHSAPFAHIPAMPELSRIADIVPDDIHERNGNRGQTDQIHVETLSLLDLLRENDAPEMIDYLSIDTEGSEYEILKTFDFAVYRFRLISVEHAGETHKRESIRSLLEGKGYARWRPELSRWDDWYWNEML